MIGGTHPGVPDGDQLSICANVKAIPVEQWSRNTSPIQTNNRLGHHGTITNNNRECLHPDIRHR
jgi:hypothetical protein